MIQGRQVRKLRELLAGGMPLYQAAMKTGMDEKTARKYRDGGKQPSELAAAHTWRTREDPFEDVWPEVASIIYWQAKEIERVITECDPAGSGVDVRLLEHVSPIEWDNVLLYGEYVIDRALIHAA